MSTTLTEAEWEKVLNAYNYGTVSGSMRAAVEALLAAREAAADDTWNDHDESHHQAFLSGKEQGAQAVRDQVEKWVLPDLIQVAAKLARYAQDDCECDHFTNHQAVALVAATDRLRAALRSGAGS
ncbi:MAG: hypothetical protein JWP74_1728 [Marmoricola sp.]|nr:hypothetical protein [Marmoricola sp.]